MRSRPGCRRRLGIVPPETWEVAPLLSNVAAPIRRLALALLAVCAVLSLQPAVSSAASPCAKGDQMPMTMSAKARNATTLCLINRERSKQGLRALRSNGKLALAARRHSSDMARNDYFGHDSRDGSRFSARIARTGWMKGRSGWTVGENLAWGSGNLATPRAIVRAWMGSPGHRRNILQPRFRLIGIGIVAGAPVRGAHHAATYTTDFGS